MHQRLELARIARLAVRREPHHLEFVAVVGESEVLRDREIEQPQGMREEDAAVDRQRRTGHASPGRADEVAESVDRADSGLVERRRERCAREVRRVMLDEPRPRPDARQIERQRFRNRVRQPAQAREVPRARRDRAVRAMANQEQRLAPEMGARVARDRKDVDVRGREPAHRQTRSHRAMWKAGDVLDAAVALLLDRRDELTVFQQRRRHVAVIRVQSEDVHAISDMTQSRSGG